MPFPSPLDLPDPGLNPGLLHCGQILYHEPPEKPRTNNLPEFPRFTPKWKSIDELICRERNGDANVDTVGERKSGTNGGGISDI